jgi:apolipoprotein N-acyltransferase
METSREQPSTSGHPIAMRKAVVLALFSSLLLGLSLPYPEQSYLALVALIPFYLAIWHQGWRRGALLGFVQGVSFQGYLLFWSTFFGIPAWAFLAIYKAMVPMAAGAWLGWVRPRSTGQRVAIFCLTWISLEYLQTFTPFGMTWGMLAQAMARHPIWLQITAYLGPWALSGLLVLVSATLAETLRQRRLLPRLTILTGSVLAFVLLLGWWRLGLPPGPEPALKVAAAQVSMGRDVKWNPNFAEVAISSLENLTRSASYQGARLVVWPETAIPYRNFRKSPGLTFRIGMLARQTRTFLLVGSIEMVGDAANHTLNTVSLVSPEGDFLDRYEKQRLVPGGEYLPFESVLRRFSIFDRVMNYVPGSRSGVFDCPITPRGLMPTLHLGNLICFESMVPYLARQRVKDGADVLVVGTNDGWFGDSAAIEHHFDIGIMRAVEAGRPLIQAGNTGVSGMIDAYGRVIQRTRPNVRTVVVGEIRPAHNVTWYVWLGDLLPQLSLLLLVLWAVYQTKRL